MKTEEPGPEQTPPQTDLPDRQTKTAIARRRLTRLMTLSSLERESAPVRTTTEHVHPAGVRVLAETAWLPSTVMPPPAAIVTA
jgi:hypothetical protein